MAPIIEKRVMSQIPEQNEPKVIDASILQNARNHSHGHVHHNLSHSNHHHQHAKENTASTRPRSSHSGDSKMCLEILDFHESWREEVEMYKGTMNAKKYISKNSHNNINMPQDYQLEMLNNVGAKKFSHVANIGAMSSSTILSPSQVDTVHTISVSNANSIINDNKLRLRADATLNEAAVGEADASNQLHLKRPREDMPSKPVSGVKHHSIRTPKRMGHSTSTLAEINPLTNPSTASSSSNNNASSPAKNKSKIIVNQFHASSLLNGHHYEEQEKILTLNGLTNPQLNTAYEASFYAANYLTPDSTNTNQINANDLNNRKTPDDDDPCTAIDDVNTYTDSDSEEEYTGEPFYLEEDGSEKQQSKHIHYQVDNDKQNSETNVTNEKACVYNTPKCILSPSLFPNVPPYLNFSSHSRSGPHLPPQLHKILKWKLSPVMPKIVKRVVLNSGFRIIKNTTDWMSVWEKHMKSPGFRTIRSHQKYNHMPGSFRIGRKDTVWRSIQSNIKKFGNKEFGFMQRSYIVPEELENLRQVWAKNASKQTKWIVKPPASARGTGISIINKWSQVPKESHFVVQKYIERPLLVNDNKFDMRIYVVMTSVNPLRIYMYKDGLARFAAVKYNCEQNNLDERCMHLTNYSINKFSQNYTKNEDVNACHGHKWTLQSLWSCLESRGVDTKRLWATLRNLVIRAIISGEAGLNRTYRQNVNFRYSCFELFGFDILLDENLVPWLLEINISPSLHSELPLDLHVKGPLIQSILNTALYQVPPKLNEKVQNDILQELKLNAPLCHDKRIFTTCLRNDEIRKHNHFTNRSMELREEYLDAILENLNPDDVRCLLVSEDELHRCSPLERIFPTPDSFKYLKYVEHPRYYNRLLDAWENRYGKCRQKGIELLRDYCKDNYHLHVSDAALEKEPKVDVTEIDMLHVRKIECPPIDDTSAPPSVDVGDSNDDQVQNYIIDSVDNLLDESKYNKSKRNYKSERY